jgi:hypothetical protein
MTDHEVHDEELEEPSNLRFSVVFPKLQLAGDLSPATET